MNASVTACSKSQTSLRLFPPHARQEGLGGTSASLEAQREPDNKLGVTAYEMP